MEAFLMKLTPYQSIFFNEWMLNPSRSDYNIIFDQSMSGFIDIQRLNKSLVRFVNDHLLLNSNVSAQSGELYWKRRPLLSENDQILTFIPQEPSPEEVLKLALQPFDLEKEQLARFYAIQLKNGGYRIIHIFSHILVDGLSANSIYTELSTYYNNPDYENPVSIAEQIELYENLRIQLEDILAKGKSEMSNFWQASLKDVENIGFKFLKTKSPDPEPEKNTLFLKNPVSELRFSFPESTFSKVRQLTSKYKLTPYTYGQLVLAVLLHKISGVDNLVINYPVGITEGQDFIFGAHINTVLKGYRFNRETSLQDLIDQNIEYTNQLKINKAKYFPVEELISYVPASDILEFGFVQTSLKDVVIHYEGARDVIINSDLNVDLAGKLSFEQEVRNGQLNYKVRYANQELSEELVFNFTEIYQRLFIDILQELLEGRTENLITNYKLLNEETFQKVINDWNTTGEHILSGTIHQLFEDQVARTPDQIALVFRQTRLTYRELNERSNRLANYLIKTYALQSEDLIPLCLERSENMLIAILAILKAGAAYVPMDPSYPSDRISHILNDTGAKIVLAQHSTAGKLQEAGPDLLILDDPHFQNMIEGMSPENPYTQAAADSLAYVIYTSGTTGLPKGVMVEHGNVVNLVDQVQEAYGYSKGEKITAYTSYVFDVSVSEFFNALLYGNELHILDEKIKKDADSISRYLLSNQIAYAYLPPVMLSVLPRVEYPALKGLLYAGEPCDYETGKYWSEYTSLYNLYGPTEATIYAVYKQVEHGDVHLIGRPVGNTTAYILDKYFQPVPVGAVGELYLGGAGIARGYLNRPDLTAERFIENPVQGKNDRLYKTGDLVRWLPDGNIEYIGRNDFQVKIRGYRIELGEIENKLYQFPGVKQSIVLVKENKTGMKYLAGYYVSDDELSAEDLAVFLSGSLPEYMIPGAFVHLTELPLTVNGKLDRKQLPEPEFTGNREYTAPQNELQQRLCQIYGEILGLNSDSISIYDDFFRLGGNSIMAIKLISKIQYELKLHADVGTVFSHKTVVSLAEVLSGENNIDRQEKIAPVPVASVEEQRLSFAQERLWFIEKYEEGSNAYNIPMVFKLGSNVKAEILQKSFEILIRRHEILRSVIRSTEDGTGYQAVTNQNIQVSVKDVQTREELDQEINDANNRVFNLEKELPLNVILFKLKDQKYLSVVIHHIAFDGWSTDIFIKEFSSICHSLAEGKVPELPALDIQYKDFALWQRNYLTGEILHQQIRYWKDKLNGFQTLDLPLDYKRPSHISYAGATEYFNLPSELVNGLRELSKNLGVSLYSVMLGGYSLMLSAYSGQDDIIVGSPVANRHHAGLENIIGFFVNTLALRQKIEPEQDLKDFILKVSQSVMEAQSHQDLPFEKLVEELEIEQDMSRHPVFQVMFGLQNFEEKIYSAGTDEVILLPFDGDIDYQTAKFDLTMMIDDNGETVRGIFNYAVSLFSRDTILRMKDTYVLLLEQLVTLRNKKEGSTRISDLFLMTREDHKKIIEDKNILDINYPETFTLHGLFENQVQRTPDRMALVYQNVRLSYHELNVRANRLANYLIETSNPQPEDMIPLFLERSEDMIVAILAVLKTGAAYVPMDPSYPADRIKHILDDTGTEIILTQEKLAGKIQNIDLTKRIISLDEASFRDLIEKSNSGNPKSEATSGHLAYVIYTSGTTGVPKGVMIEHGSVVNVVTQVRDAYGFSENEKITAYTSYVFDVSVSEFFNALLFGNELHILDEAIKKDADLISRYLLDHQIAYAYLPPVMLSVLPRTEYPVLKGLLYAGEPCDYETGKYWSEYTSLYNLYGPTEATIYATYKKVEHGDVHLIGHAVGNTSVYVLDAHCRPVPVGAIGELYLGGVGIARGYLNRPELTSERFIPNPFQTEEQKRQGKNGKLYKTGDLVKYHADGELEYIGRNDFQVKIRGYRIELGEIENQLLASPLIRQAVVLAKTNKAGMKYLAGYYVSDHAIEPYEISEFLAETLPEYMIPSVYVHLEQLPVTVNGKLDRNQLPEPEFTISRGYTAPENELQEKLCRVYADVLGLNASAIGIHDDFFRLGGNSIMAIRLISSIKKALHISIGVAVVFTHKTVASLSHIIAGKAVTDGHETIVPVKVSSPEEQRLSFAQERLWFIENFEGGSNAYNVPMAFRLGKDIQLDLLQKSLETLIVRHEVLRSMIRTAEKGSGYQEVTDLIPEFRYAEAETKEELEKNIDQCAHKIFRLEKEIPVEITILRWKEDHYLSVVVHHIAFDGWSADIFLKELETVYNALAKGENPQLPELKIQYKDFALWQRNYLTGEILEKQISYWKNKLEDFETLSLPLDFKRPANISYEGATVHFSLSPEVGSGLRKLSREWGVSLYSMMLGGYYLMLSTYSGQDDIVVGSPIANRHHEGLEDMIGFFVNTLALREKISAEQDLKDFILQISQSVTEAQSYQELPFEKLVDELDIEQDTSKHPVFQVMFGVQSFGMNINKETVFTPLHHEINYQAAKFDLTTMIDDGEETIRGMFNYATSLFKKETILRMQDTYILLLHQLAKIGEDSDKKIRIRDFRLLKDTDYSMITETWNDTDSDYPCEKTVHQLFEDQVMKTPDAVALVYQDIELSFKELNERSNRLANYLLNAYDLQPDDLIPLCLERSENMPVAMLAVLKTGAAYVPMDPSYPSERIEHILHDTKAKIVLGQESTIKQLKNKAVDTISLDEVTFKAVLETFESNNPVTAVTANNLAYVIYTSGTTGMPKGVLIEHKGVANLIQQHAKEYGFIAEHAVQQKNSLWYANYVFDAHVAEFYPALVHGQCVHLLNKETQTDLVGLQQYIKENNISIATIPPVLLTKEHILPLEILLVAGDVTNPQVMALYKEHGVDLINGYGPTESTVCTTLHHYNDDENPLNIGKAIGNLSVYVLDHYQRPIPVGAIGELYVGGTGVARGYLNRPELTEERFIT
ncbi:amino acid adenylation domain-containing protein, partial [Chryseobacterium gossypii]|uniref:amino acid adenylation domain-containing protein n=1 Tax=Chryseobacterium gossypii TaxID=3231602 RepID=UPI0035256DE3